MIEITLMGPGGLFDQAEADDPESAVFAARTLFDEVTTGQVLQGFRKSLVLRFAVDGKTVRVLQGVRP